MAVLVQISRSNGGIPKLAVEGPVMLGCEGVEGDRHRNPQVHGGPDKAVLMVAAESLEDLAERGYPVYPGALGENLTVSGLDSGLWRSGQRYRVGDAVIELTTPREPCRNLDVYGPAIKAELLNAGCNHGGFYARVIRTGLVVAGAAVLKEFDVC
jgi:MOSC domain-containing protein YiiM